MLLFVACSAFLGVHCLLFDVYCWMPMVCRSLLVGLGLLVVVIVVAWDLLVVVCLAPFLCCPLDLFVVLCLIVVVRC